MFVDVLDLSYVLIKKKLSTINLSKFNEVCYVFDYKAQRVQNKNFITLSKVDENVEWLNIGGTYVKKKTQISIDVKTTDKKDYSILKDEIRKVFDGKTLNYYSKSIPDVEYIDTVDEIGTYLRLCNDVNNILAEGQYVHLSQIDEYGWVVWKDNTNAYIFTGLGQYFLSRPANIKELSGELKGLYRFNIDVEWQVIQKQR